MVSRKMSSGMFSAVSGDGKDPRVGNHDVQPAELGNAVVDRCLQLREVAESAFVAMMRRSSASTAFTVSARSSGGALVGRPVDRLASRRSR